jgi:hypothetical protein
MKLKYDFNPIIHNRVILYFLFFIALIDMMYFLNIKDMYAFSTLILIGLLTSFFVKNMTIILFVALITTHLLKYGRSSFSEGMKGSKDDSEEDKDDETGKSSSKLTKMKDLTKQIKELSTSKESSDSDSKRTELVESLSDMKETRDKIMEGVKDMQPLLEKFQGYAEKFNDYKGSSN